MGRKRGRTDSCQSRLLWAGIALLAVAVLLTARRPFDTTYETQYADDETSALREASGGSQKLGTADDGNVTAPLDSGAFPRLSKDLAWRHARDGLIFVTWTNGHLVDFAQNWAASLTALGLNNFLIGAMDVQAAEELTAAGAPVFAMFEQHAEDTGLTSEDMGWSMTTFHKMCRQKVDLAATFTEFGLQLVLCDADTAWINDPTAYFARYAAADVLSSLDQFAPTQPPGDDGLEAWSVMDDVGNNLNIGLLLFRPTSATTAFLAAWAAALEADDALWDQNAFNELVHKGKLKQHPKHDRLALGFDRSFTVGVLSLPSFASGHTFFVQKMYERHRVKPYVAHVTFVYGGIPAKRHRLREAGLWRDPDDYYSSRRFLAVEVTKPVEPADFGTWHNSKMAAFHLAAAKAQLAEVRDAISIAVALNRTLIIPALYCFCDRYWDYMTHCHAEDSDFPLPFVCPLDHLIDPERLAEAAPWGREAAPLEFREYSFLENPRVPAQVRNGAVEVAVAGSTGDVTIAAKGAARVTLPEAVDEVELANKLEAHMDAPVLRVLGSPSALFGGFRNATTAALVEARFLGAVDEWCCFRSVAEDPETITEEMQIHNFADDFKKAISPPAA